jgi:hypothetical protein
MATRIDQTKYPNLLGNGSDKVGLAILGYPITSYIGSVYTITVNNGNYMNYTTTPPSNLIFNGNGQFDGNETDISLVSNEIFVFDDDLSKVINNNIKVSFSGLSSGTYTFYQGISYGVSNSNISITGGTLIFDASNNPNSQFYIYANTISITNCSFILKNKALAQNIFWYAKGNLEEEVGITVSNESNVVYGVLQTLYSIIFSGILNGNIFAGSGYAYFSSNSTINTPTICYLKGTKILTNQGYKMIEELKEGDLIITKGIINNNINYQENEEESLQPITWINKFSPPILNKYSFPICIKSNSFGENIPFEDLYISPGHRILIKGELVLAIDLINNINIFQDYNFKFIEYYHLELPNHYGIFANGLLSESYLNIDTKHIFTN